MCVCVLDYNDANVRCTIDSRNRQHSNQSQSVWRTDRVFEIGETNAALLSMDTHIYPQ